MKMAAMFQGRPHIRPQPPLRSSSSKPTNQHVAACRFPIEANLPTPVDDHKTDPSPPALDDAISQHLTPDLFFRSRADLGVSATALARQDLHLGLSIFLRHSLPSSLKILLIRNLDIVTLTALIAHAYHYLASNPTRLFVYQ